MHSAEYPDEEVDDLHGDRVVELIELIEEDENGGLDVHDAVAVGVVEEPVEEERQTSRGGGRLRLHRGSRALGVSVTDTRTAPHRTAGQVRPGHDPNRSRGWPAGPGRVGPGRSRLRRPATPHRTAPQRTSLH